MKRAASIASLIIPCALTVCAHATDVQNLTTFSAGTPARAAEVNANFNEVKTAVDDNHTRIGALQTSVAGLGDRVSALENPGDELGPLMYGDGSAGDLVVSTNVNWIANSPTNLNFANCTIQSGVTLAVSAGTTIRCSGTFSNSGTIAVNQSGLGGLINYDAYIQRLPLLGDMTMGSGPEMPTSIEPLSDFLYDGPSYAGFGGTALQAGHILSNLATLRMGGAGGTGAADGAGGSGGGLIRILVGGQLSNAGTINANAFSGAGGGGGGIIILASRTAIVHTGTSSARGGNGSSSTSYRGASGGGGGGIVVMIAPSVTDSGTVNVAGGTAGLGTIGVTGTPGGLRAGGGGGGASGGMGGMGAALQSLLSAAPSTPATVVTPAAAGSVGQIFRLEQDPLFVVR